MKAFDKKFGAKFLAGLPTTPGVYRVFNLDDELIYIGKAKNLRRRLSQYRNAKRRKRHLKMRTVVSEGIRIEIETHGSDREASLAEAKLIQNLRPKLNVAGAFYFMYPMIGVSSVGRDLELIFTTEPEALETKLVNRFSFHGAYRSRFFCGRAFFALVELLEFIGHKNKTQKPSKYSYHYSFRQIDSELGGLLQAMLKGESNAFFEPLMMALIENKSARKKPKDIQKLLNAMKTFWKHEAQLLYRVRNKLGFQAYPVPQKQRDILFLEHRFFDEKTNARKQILPARA